MQLVVLTGLSGAGKTTALHALEDLDFYCADNLPIPLVPQLIELLARPGKIRRAALVVDARSGEFLERSTEVLAAVRAAGHTVEVLFLDAPDEVLIRRFSETRRRHPLPAADIRAALQDERRRLSELRSSADMVISTGAMTVHALRAVVLDRYRQGAGGPLVTLLSFGFKHGLPAEADVVLDARFLPNPYFVPELSAGTGRDPAVRDYVLASEEANLFLDRATELLALSVRGFQREGKAYATLAIGCTGGRHRSVALAEELARRLGHLARTTVRHRDLALP